MRFSIWLLVGTLLTACASSRQSPPSPAGDAAAPSEAEHVRRLLLEKDIQISELEAVLPELDARLSSTCRRHMRMVSRAPAQSPQEGCEGHDEVAQLRSLLAEKTVRLSELKRRRRVLTYLMGQCREFPQLLGIISPPGIAGEVTAVSEDYGLVVLSVGLDDYVMVGYEFRIFRGEEYVGRARITGVGKDWSSGRSMPDLQRMPIRVGDQATTSY